jgi:hypothetical protein
MVFSFKYRENIELEILEKFVGFPGVNRVKNKKTPNYLIIKGLLEVPSGFEPLYEVLQTSA